MDKSILIQKQVRENAQDLHSFMSDMHSWENEMKRKEADLTGIPYEEKLPPVRSKVKKPKSESQPKSASRISGADYIAWDKFDADKACEEIDEEEVSVSSLDSEMSDKEKLAKLKEEAQEEKEKGNEFVKNKKWDEAIGCYTRAIDLVNDDAIYFANRGFCYLKKENLHAAETDCTKAISLDPSYVKAYQRRACAREALGSLRSASIDIKKVIELEPNNLVAKKQLAILTQKMGTKGPNSKISPATTPSTEKAPALPSPNNKTATTPEKKSESKACAKEDDLIDSIEKPPHLRSKKPLVRVPITEIPLGSSLSTSEVLNITDVPSKKVVPENLRNGDSAETKEETKSPRIVNEKSPITNVTKVKEKKLSPTKQSFDMVNLSNLNLDDEKDACYQIPKSAVQFLSQWKMLKGRDKARSQYLKLIPPKSLPLIFQNSLESDILSEVLETLCYGDDFTNKNIGAALPYLECISRVKRFGALCMFLNTKDKESILKILQECADKDKCTLTEMKEIKNKYEIV